MNKLFHSDNYVQLYEHYNKINEIGLGWSLLIHEYIPQLEEQSIPNSNSMSRSNLFP